MRKEASIPPLPSMHEPPPGLVTLALGDVVDLNEMKWIVERVWDGGARLIHASGVREPVALLRPWTRPGRILERWGEEGLKQFLAGAKEPVDGNTNNEKEKGNEMANNAKARGGLAAEKAQDEAKVKGKAKGKGRGAKATKAKTAGGQSRSAFMDTLFTGEYTKREIAAMTHKKFGGDEAIILKAANDRPFHMRKAGLKPTWKEEPKAEKATAAAAA